MSGEIFDAFLGDYSEFKTFFHGHSYSGNPPDCAAATASLEILADDETKKNISALDVDQLREKTQIFWDTPMSAMSGRKEPSAPSNSWPISTPETHCHRRRDCPGARVCEAAKKHGLLTRPIGNVLVLMLPYCITEAPT